VQIVEQNSDIDSQKIQPGSLHQSYLDKAHDNLLQVDSIIVVKGVFKWVLIPLNA
jgi:hypothetical protein